MAFVAPIPLIRKRHIIGKLLKANAVSSESAVTLHDAGVINPTVFKAVTQRMIKDGVLCSTGDKYYLDVTRI